jgi:hypothetical protein
MFLDRLVFLTCSTVVFAVGCGNVANYPQLLSAEQGLFVENVGTTVHALGAGQHRLVSFAFPVTEWLELGGALNTRETFSCTCACNWLPSMKVCTELERIPSSANECEYVGRAQATIWLHSDLDCDHVIDSSLLIVEHLDYIIAIRHMRDIDSAPLLYIGESSPVPTPE